MVDSTAAGRLKARIQELGELESLSEDRAPIERLKSYWERELTRLNTPIT